MSEGESQNTLVEAGLDAEEERGVWGNAELRTDEGALSFFTSICCPIWDHPYNRSLEWRVDNNEIRSYLSLVGAGDGGGEVVLVEVQREDRLRAVVHVGLQRARC
jgi:hypothetical protein